MPQNHGFFAFFELFPDEKSCRAFLENKLWKNGPVCPHCGYIEHIYRYKNGKLFKCADCGRQFQVTTNTIFQNSNLPLRKWFLAYYLISTNKKGISSIQLAKALEITQKSAWYLAHKIRYMWLQDSGVKLSKIVECDETYVGGKMKGGKRGRGSENKTPVFGMLQRKGQLIIMPVSDTKRRTIEPIIRQTVKKGSEIMTDEWWAYKQLNRWYLHGVVKHKIKEYVRGNIHVNSLEGAWSLLKRSIRALCKPSKQHLDKYCAEFQFRYMPDTEMSRFQASKLLEKKTHQKPGYSPVNQGFERGLILNIE